MGLKYIENTGRNVMFVGGKLIPPGEGREVDELLLPPELQDSPVVVAATADPSVAQRVAELLKGNVKTVVAELVALTGEALDLVETIEGGADAPRKGVLAAVKAERLRRASEKLDGGQADGGQDQAQAAFDAAVQAAYQKQLDALTPEQLAALGEAEHAKLREQAELDVLADAEHPPGA